MGDGSHIVATKVEMLSNVTVLIGDTKADRASTLADGLKEFGFGTTTIALSYKEAVAKLEEGGIDVAILSDSLGGGIFKLVRGVRQMLVGKNPFVTIFCALAPEHVDGAKLALRAGVDSILIRRAVGSNGPTLKITPRLCIRRIRLQNLRKPVTSGSSSCRTISKKRWVLMRCSKTSLFQTTFSLKLKRRCSVKPPALCTGQKNISTV